MRAVVLSETMGALRAEDVPKPSPGLGEVLLKVAACGVCHTDLHVIKGEVSFPLPCVLGHEVAGTIADIGEGVHGLSVGDRVACSFIMPCGSCRHCVRGNEDLCERFFAFNRLRGTLYDGNTRIRRTDGSPLWMYSMGGLAEYSVVPATGVFRLPEGLNVYDAAVLGCSVLTSLGAVKNVGQVSVGETVAVIAAGGIGINIVRMAAVFGASRIVVVDVADEKLAFARKMGATDVVNATKDDAVARIRDITGGRGVDVAFEALGTAATVETAIKSVDDGGRVVLVGIAPAGVAAGLDITHVVRRKVKILGSYGARPRTDMPLILQLAAEGKLQVSDIITSRFALHEADEAYRRLSEGRVVGRALIEIDRSEPLRTRP